MDYTIQEVCQILVEESDSYLKEKKFMKDLFG